MIRNWIAGAVVVLMSATLVAPTIAEAKRLGGGKSQGMQRNTPAQQAPQTPPQTPAAPQPGAATPSPAAAPAAAGAAAQAGKRSWLGPIAGLAAGLGIAALLSSMGFGEGLATFVTILLLGLVAFFVIRFLLARFGGGNRAPAMAGPGAGATRPVRREEPALQPVQPAAPVARAAEPAAFVPASQDVSVTGQPLAPAFTAAPAAIGTGTGPNLPPGFDLPAFERIAKMIFIRLQAANDAGDLDDLRQFTTPEMFAVARLELQERGSAAQHTDVVQVDSQVLDFAVEDGKQIVSVRFHGKVREAEDAAPEAFDEIWHLVKPADDSRPWAIAGIQQPQ